MPGAADAQSRALRPIRSLGSGAEVTAGVHLGDLDGDGDLDVSVANGRHWPGQNRVYFNDGGGSFTLARRLGDDEDASYAAPPGDFDGDGDLDIATGNDRTGKQIFLNDGTGRFSTRGEFGMPSNARSLTLADLDADGNLDILVVNRGQQNLIHFGDGHLDIVNVNIRQPNAVYFGSEDGFGESAEFGRADDASFTIAIADLDGDGDPDIVVGNVGSENALYFNDGAGVFHEVRFGCNDCETYSFAVGDLNGMAIPMSSRATRGAPNYIFLNVPAGR